MVAGADESRPLSEQMRPFVGLFFGCFGATVGLLAVTIAGSLMFTAEYSRCTIINDSGGPISLTAWVDEQAFSVSNLAPGESCMFQYRPPGESQYVLKVEYDDGEVVILKEGYIDGGGQTDRIIVSRSGTAWEHEFGFESIPNPAPRP